MDKYGFFIIIKVVYGGGGCGMCVVCEEVFFKEFFERVIFEVKSVFGNGIVFVECFFDKFKYIEVQFFGDNYGNIVYLYECDCFVQCRY